MVQDEEVSFFVHTHTQQTTCRWLWSVMVPDRLICSCCCDWTQFIPWCTCCQIWLISSAFYLDHRRAFTVKHQVNHRRRRTSPRYILTLELAYASESFIMMELISMVTYTQTCQIGFDLYLEGMKMHRKGSKHFGAQAPRSTWRTGMLEPAFNWKMNVRLRVFSL